MVPLTGTSSFVTFVSFAITGASFTALMVNIKVSFTQIAGRGSPLSHTDITTVSVPL